MGFAEGAQVAGAALPGPQAGHLFPVFVRFAVEDYMKVANFDGDAFLSAGGFRVLRSIAN